MPETIERSSQFEKTPSGWADLWLVEMKAAQDDDVALAGARRQGDPALRGRPGGRVWRSGLRQHPGEPLHLQRADAAGAPLREDAPGGREAALLGSGRRSGEGGWRDPPAHAQHGHRAGRRHLRGGAGERALRPAPSRAGRGSVPLRGGVRRQGDPGEDRPADGPGACPEVHRAGEEGRGRGGGLRPLARLPVVPGPDLGRGAVDRLPLSDDQGRAGRAASGKRSSWTSP